MMHITTTNSLWSMIVCTGEDRFIISYFFSFFFCNEGTDTISKTSSGFSVNCEDIGRALNFQ
jgi:hypothetical protein